MDFDSQRQAETGLLYREVGQKRNDEHENKAENSEVQQRKQKKKIAVFYIKVALSEIIGTAMLLFLGCAGLVPGLIGAPSILQVAVVFGLAIFVIIQTFFHLSGGHLNPAITTAALIFKVVTPPAGAVYIAAQFVGAILGYGLLLVVIPEKAFYSSGQLRNITHGLCTTLPNPAVALWQAFIAEFVATAVLIFICCAIWDKKNESQLPQAPIRLGLTIMLLAASMAQISGCSLNPARTLAPALFTNVWDHQWIYWLGPISASVATSYFYIFVFSSFEKPTSTPETERT